MENPWENHGKSSNMSPNIGKTNGKSWDNMGQQYDIYEILGNHIGTCGKSKDPFSNDFGVN